MGYKDYNNSMNTYMKQRWVKRRAAAIAHLGGKCLVCGTTEGLEFDHVDPTTKIMTVARAASRSEEFFWNEVNKCQLLCKAHHLIKTGEDLLRARVSS
jgi:5-methylcytosine-specific restriction endonuclease McrA